MNAGRRRKRVLVLGLPYFGKMLAERLTERGWQADYLPHPGRNAAGWAKVAARIARCDVLYLIGSRIERGSPQDWLMRMRRRPVVIHWVGTDVQVAAEAYARGRLSRRIANRAVHWADAPWLVDELAAIGVKAGRVRLPIPIATGGIARLPEAFSVLLYLPQDAYDREVFDVEAILRLPREFPGVQFTLVPSTRDSLPELPANVRTPGFVRDMNALYRETTVMVRQTAHDGMSFMAAEAVSRGRYVIWSFPLDGAILARGFAEVAAALRDLEQKHLTGTLAPNQEGAELVREQFDQVQVLDELNQRLQALLVQNK